MNEQNQIIEILGKVLERLTNIENRLDGLENRFDRLETKVDRLETKVDRLETKVDQLETKVDQLETKVDRLEADNQSTKQLLKKLSHSINRVEMQGAAIGFELKDDVRKLHEKLDRTEFDTLAARTQSVQNRNDIRALTVRVEELETAGK